MHVAVVRHKARSCAANRSPRGPPRQRYPVAHRAEPLPCRPLTSRVGARRRNPITTPQNDDPSPNPEVHIGTSALAPVLSPCSRMGAAVESAATTRLPSLSAEMVQRTQSRASVVYRFVHRGVSQFGSGGLYKSRWRAYGQIGRRAGPGLVRISLAGVRDVPVGDRCRSACRRCGARLDVGEGHRVRPGRWGYRNGAAAALS
jgi:hypothetical protein